MADKEDKGEQMDQSKRPEDSNFKQQRLKAWQPLLTPFYVILTFFIIGIVFIPIGAAIYTASKGIKEVEVQYDKCGSGSTPGLCQVFITIPEEMKLPVYVYYKLTNFYQNHRRYVKSRSDPQLSGDSLTDTASCDPLENNDSNQKLYPCGLIANSFFNDTFIEPTLTLNGVPTPLTGGSWQKEGIAWTSDKDKKFKKKTLPSGFTNISPPALLAHKLPDVDDEDLMVWMRTAGLPTFKKLHRKITSLPNGADSIPEGAVLNVTINNVFQVHSFSGSKYLVLSTTSWMGGKNDFLGLAYIIVGSLCIFLGAIFLIKHLTSPRTLGDMHFLNQWSGAGGPAASGGPGASAAGGGGSGGGAGAAAGVSIAVAR